MLQYIPMSVLYGVFLFMGVSSVKGIQVTSFVVVWIEVVDQCLASNIH